MLLLLSGEPPCHIDVLSDLTHIIYWVVSRAGRDTSDGTGLPKTRPNL